MNTDDQLIEAIENNSNFTTVTDSDHLAELFGMDSADAKMAADIAVARDAILNRIARHARSGMARVTVAMVWNWPELDGVGAVPVERAMRELIAEKVVGEDMHYGSLAFYTF